MTEPQPGMSHIHWHRQVAEIGSFVYYECRCGSRTSGRRGGTRRATPLDREWLTGAHRGPQ